MSNSNFSLEPLFAYAPQSLEEWPHLAELIDVGDRFPIHIHLAGLVCEALSKGRSNAEPMIAALLALFQSIVITDDVLDDDPGLHNVIGAGRVANLALALQAMSQGAIEKSHYSAEIKYRASQCLNRAAFDTAFGQSIDVTQAVKCDETYWRNARCKSSPFFAAAFQLGALAADANEFEVDVLRQVGVIYGETVQVSDDLRDALTETPGKDWHVGTTSLPILFAATVPHREQVQFCHLFSTVAARTDSAEVVQHAFLQARAIVVRSGAVAYCIDQIVQRYWQSIHLLSQIQLDQSPLIQQWLAKSYRDPVNMLLQKAGVKSVDQIWEQSTFAEQVVA